MAAHPVDSGTSHNTGHVPKKKGIRGAFKIGNDTTIKGKGKQMPAKGPVGAVKVPKDKGRLKRKVKTTHNSPKKTTVSYG